MPGIGLVLSGPQRAPGGVWGAKPQEKGAAEPRVHSIGEAERGGGRGGRPSPLSSPIALEGERSVYHLGSAPYDP